MSSTPTGRSKFEKRAAPVKKRVVKALAEALPPPVVSGDDALDLIRKAELAAASAAQELEPDEELEPDQPELEPDQFVPDAIVAKELAITLMTMWRWDRSQEMIDAGWPPPMRMGRGKGIRKYRSRRRLEKFKQNVFRAALRDRAQTR